MKVAITFDFSDDERRAICRYRRSRGSKVPTLATREMVRDFIHEAISNQWSSVHDQSKAEDAWNDTLTVLDRNAHLEERKYDIEVVRGY